MTLRRKTGGRRTTTKSCRRADDIHRRIRMAWMACGTLIRRRREPPSRRCCITSIWVAMPLGRTGGNVARSHRRGSRRRTVPTSCCDRSDRIILVCETEKILIFFLFYFVLIFWSPLMSRPQATKIHDASIERATLLLAMPRHRGLAHAAKKQLKPVRRPSDPFKFARQRAGSLRLMDSPSSRETPTRRNSSYQPSSTNFFSAVASSAEIKFKFLFFCFSVFLIF